MTIKKKGGGWVLSSIAPEICTRYGYPQTGFLTIKRQNDDEQMLMVLNH